MSDFTFRISPNIVLGTFVSSRLGQFAKDYGERFMLVIDPILKDSGTDQKIIQGLEDRNIDFFVFNEIPGSADTKTLENALSLAKESHIHGILACGGGKAISLGRAISALFSSEKGIYDIIDNENEVIKCPPLPLICLPTTSRDPFVFTNRIPVIDSRTKKIKVLRCHNDLCKMVLIDPNLASTLTENQSNALGFEIINLAIEAYSSQKASFFSDMIVEKTVEIMNYAMEGTNTLTITTPKEVLMAQAGCMASLAAGSSSLGAVSLLSLAINARYGISRPIITSILLPHVIEDIAKFKTDKLAKIASLIGLTEENTPTEEAAKILAENMRSRLTKSNLPARLKDLNITMEQLSLAAEDAGELDLINNLPRSMTADDLFDLIKIAY